MAVDTMANTVHLGSNLSLLVKDERDIQEDHSAEACEGIGSTNTTTTTKDGSVGHGRCQVSNHSHAIASSVSDFPKRLRLCLGVKRSDATIRVY